MSEPGTRAPRAGNRYVLTLSVAALGVVYGDIGTSPLYAFREAFHSAHGLEVDRTAVLGIVSLILWSLALIVSIKYLAFVMRADNKGEGGILALTSLVSPRRSYAASNGRRALVLLGLFGTALLYGDGLITPAISVLSAVEGIEVVAPGLGGSVLPVATVILILLFSIQFVGTGKVGAFFGPIMVVWFATLAALGVAHIGDDPAILGAASPARALAFAAAQPKFAFLALGGIFLVVTGAEALYADMGHFGTRPIRLTWFALVLPSLALNYLGQGALLLSEPEAIDNPFYRMAPEWALVPLVVLATAATVIASQALISGAYSLTMQAVQFGYLPRVRIDHTSREEFGQVYVPGINWLLMVGCIALVWSFRSSSNLAAAYGVAVTATMVVTAVLLYIVMRERWVWSRPVAAAVTGGFLLLDLAFFGSNLLKLVDGGWFPLVVGGGVFVVMTTWQRGRELLTKRMRTSGITIERFLANLAGDPPGRVEGTAVYLVREAGIPPPALLANLRHHGVLHEDVVLLTVRTVSAPHVVPAKRCAVHRLGDGFTQVLLQFGFMDEPALPEALVSLVVPGFGFDPDTATYFLGRERVISASLPGMARWRERLFGLMHRNARNAAEYFGLPADRVVEVGTQVEI